MDTVETVKARYNYWSGKGLTGNKIWEALASDEKLPLFLHPKDAAELAGFTVFALKIRRARKQEPPFVAVSSKNVRYPTSDYCRWLANRFQEGAR